MLYGIIFLPYVLRVTVELEEYNPRMIHLAAFAGFVGTLL